MQAVYNAHPTEVGNCRYDSTLAASEAIMPRFRVIAVAAMVLLAIAAAFVVWRGRSDATRAPATTPAIAPALRRRRPRAPTGRPNRSRWLPPPAPPADRARRSRRRAGGAQGAAPARRHRRVRREARRVRRHGAVARRRASPIPSWRSSSRAPPTSASRTARWRPSATRSSSTRWPARVRPPRRAARPNTRSTTIRTARGCARWNPSRARTATAICASTMRVSWKRIDTRGTS